MEECVKFKMRFECVKGTCEGENLDYLKIYWQIYYKQVIHDNTVKKSSRVAAIERIMKGRTPNKMILIASLIISSEVILTRTLFLSEFK